MGIRLSRSLVALLLVLVFLSSGFAGCGTVQPVSSSASVASSSALVVNQGSSEGVDSMDAGSASASVAEEVDSNPLAEALPLPSEPFYYSGVRTPGKGQASPLFLYGLDRNVLAPLTYEVPLVIPEGVTAVPISAYYAATFAGHGLLAWMEEEQQTVNISRDGGATWEQVGLPIRATSWTLDRVLGLGFTSPVNGWVAIHGNHNWKEYAVCIFTTQDGGKTWGLSGEQEVGDYGATVRFVTAEHGFLFTRTEEYSGQLLETWDGGKTWERCQIVLPSGFANPSDAGIVEELVYDGQRVTCTYGALAYDENETDNWVYVSMLLAPVEEGGRTVWRFEDTWELPPGTSPYAFFHFIDNIYNPDFYGIEENTISHDLLDRLTFYVDENDPAGYTKTGAWNYLFSAELVENMLAVTYNLQDFDVTTLDPYSTEEESFVWNCGGDHGRGGQDSLIFSVHITQEGNIEVIRDASVRNVGYRLERGGIMGESQMQRCVFKPATCANGEAVFTIIECENLDAYPEE